MKFLLTLTILIASSSVFAEGAWRIDCSNKSGISFYATNGESKILSSYLDKKGVSKISSREASVEDYDLSPSEKKIKISWLGLKETISDSQKTLCHRDQIRTVFRQKVEIKQPNSKTLITEVTCIDELLTSSGAEIDECLTN